MPYILSWFHLVTTRPRLYYAISRCWAGPSIGLIVSESDCPPTRFNLILVLNRRWFFVGLSRFYRSLFESMGIFSLRNISLARVAAPAIPTSAPVIPKNAPVIPINALVIPNRPQPRRVIHRQLRKCSRDSRHCPRCSILLGQSWTSRPASTRTGIVSVQDRRGLWESQGQFG